MTLPFAQHWELDSDTTYLNHGSFGPSPICVRRAREDWSARLERQPMRFFLQDMERLLDETAVSLASFLHTKPDRLALIDNSSMAMNIAAASISLEPGDEVLFTDHEYGAVRRIWQQKCRDSEARLVTVPLPLPPSDDAVEAALESACTERTRVLVFSHVTSPTALILPARTICRFAKQRGILTVIDGPHAIAMLDLHLDDLGCDYYCGSCHKWLCAAFGSGFVWVHPRHHGGLKCPMISWGGSIAGRPAAWQDRVNWLGTRDPAALFTISRAITFLSDIGADVFRTHARELVSTARRRLLDLNGVCDLPAAGADNFVSMLAMELPQPAGWEPGYHGQCDPLQQELRERFQVEIPVFSWNGKRLLRLSAHLYNSVNDIDRLLTALSAAEHLYG